MKRLLLMAVLLCTTTFVPRSWAYSECIAILVVPKYPPIAREARITGVVRATIEVEQNGEITSVDTVGPVHELLKVETAKIVREWRFCTADEPKKRTVVLDFVYILRGKPSDHSCQADVRIDFPTITITAQPPLGRTEIFKITIKGNKSKTKE
jgi:TonB family protein